MQWHNKFHLEMPKGLVNDPNGLCYHQGKYQIFFQWNPFGCEHKHKHWTYTQTTDFINYTKPQIALAPVDKFDKDGCYSGSARSKNNKLEIIYTANLKDEQNIRYPRQVLVKQNDNGEFIKEKIIIDTVPKGYTTHFRDPYIFTKNNRSFIILGAQRENLTGCALIYEEIDENWIFRGELKTQLTDFGYMWECPNFAEVNGHEALILSPQGVKPEGNKFLNVHQSGYFLGKMDYQTGIFHRDSKFDLLDYGFDFYAPQIMQDEKNNRCLMIAWLDMWESNMPEQENHWAGMMSIPRVLEVKDNMIYSKPIEELSKLYKLKIHHEQVIDDVISFDDVNGDCYKLDIDFDLKNAQGFALKLRVSATEETVISYDKDTKKFKLNRDKSGCGVNGEREVYIEPVGEKMNLQIFSDRSSLEIFINDGQHVLSSRIYPSKEAKGIVFIPNGNIKANVDFYEI